MPEGDLVAILTYLDGELSTDEQIALELRLAEEPELAQAFEAFEALDRIERWAHARSPKRRDPRWVSGGILVTAVLAAIVLGLALA